MEVFFTDSGGRYGGVVAIVDDDLQISQALGLWLDLQGVNTAHFSSGEYLLHALHPDEGGISLHFGVTTPMVMPLVGAVLDLNLPGVTGFELARALRSQFPALPIVVITALREEERDRYGVPPKGVRCLQKPFDLDALEDALFPLLN